MVKAVIDADTIIYRCAALCQTNFDVISKETGKVVDYTTSKKDFKRNLPENVDPDNFEFENKIRPVRVDSGVDSQVVGFHAVNREFEKLQKVFDWIDEYEFCIHGEGNFRNEIATIKPYKGNRPDKPLFFNHVKEFVMRRHKDILTVVNGEETDDYVARLGWEAWGRCKDKKEFTDSDTIIFHIDKDLDQVPGRHYDYDKEKEYIITPRQAARSFWTQCLMGDKGDNIPGLPKLLPEFKEKYGLRSSGGFGETTAKKYLTDCEKPREMAERVVEAYKTHIGEGWLDYLQEVASLLYLRKEEGKNFDIRKSLFTLGVDYV